MFARFRDENALPGPGFLIPGMLPAASDSPRQADPFHLLILKDGRKLAWSEYGHRHGYPILYMHRQAGSRLEALFLHEAARAAGFRLIAVDRPGIGQSDYCQIRSPDQLADDYAQLLDHLDVVHAGIFAWGAGSRFALALASHYPHRVSVLKLLAPVEYPSKFADSAVLRFAVTLGARTLMSFRSAMADQDESRYINRWREHLCYADRKQIDDPWVGALLARNARESLRQGAIGVAQDIWLGLSGVDLDVPSLTVPVHVWNGSADTIQPLRAGLSVAGNDSDLAGTAATDKLVVRHCVHRQGHLFFGQAAGDIFRVTRQALGFSPVAGGRQPR